VITQQARETLLSTAQSTARWKAGKSSLHTDRKVGKQPRKNYLLLLFYFAINASLKIVLAFSIFFMFLT